MSKVSKILISLSFAFIVAFSFMFNNLQPLFVKADSIANYNVSFIAPDNSLLYEVSGVPSGVSLQELNDSNLINSYYNGSLNYTHSGWSRNNLFDNTYVDGYGNYIYNDLEASITMTTDSNNNSYAHLLYYFPNDNYSSLYLNFDLIDSSLTQNSLAMDICYSNSIGGSVNALQSYYVGYNNLIAGHYSHLFEFTSSNADYLCLRFYVHSNVIGESVSLKNINLSLNNYPYLNLSYINDLLSEYNFSNYYYQYDLDYSQPITSDKYFYPNKYTREYDTWINKNWNGLTSFSSSYIWTDGVNYYYSNFREQYVLDISTNTWVPKTWNGTLGYFYGNYVWTDGVNYYYSSYNEQYVLDVATSTWTQKTWYGFTEVNGAFIWTDGVRYYYSNGSQQYALSGLSWISWDWTGLTSFSGSYIWTDGYSIYYSNDTTYVLSGSSWTQVNWNGLSSVYGINIWSYDNRVYYSNGSIQRVLDVSTRTWNIKNWNGFTNIVGMYVWNSDIGVFYSSGSGQYVLGSSLIPLDSDYYYQNGYNTGFNVGYTGGYNNGYNIGYYTGVENAGNYTFFSLISAVIDAPLKTITGLFNFELLGVNLFNLFTGLLTLAVLLFVIKLVLGGK